MINRLFIVLVLGLNSCSKYKLIQEIDTNKYHLYNEKKGSVEIIETDKKLEVGKFYNIKELKKKGA